MYGFLDILHLFKLAQNFDFQIKQNFPLLKLQCIKFFLFFAMAMKNGQNALWEFIALTLTILMMFTPIFNTFSMVHFCTNCSQNVDNFDFKISLNIVFDAEISS